MANKYKGTCYRCGETVEPGAGIFERQYSRFRVQHHVCAHLYKDKISPYQQEQAKAGVGEAVLDVQKFQQKAEKSKVMYPIQLDEWVRANWGTIMRQAAFAKAKEKGVHVFSVGDSMSRAKEIAAFYLTQRVSKEFLVKNMPQNPHIEPEKARELIRAAIYKEFLKTVSNVEFIHNGR